MTPEAQFPSSGVTGKENISPEPIDVKKSTYDSVVFDNKMFVDGLPEAIRTSDVGSALVSIQQELDSRKLVADIFAWNTFLERLAIYSRELKEKNKEDIVEDIAFPIGAHIADGEGALVIRKGQANPGMKISSRNELRSFDWYREHASDYGLVSHELSPEATAIIRNILTQVSAQVYFEHETGDVSTTVFNGRQISLGDDTKDTIVLSKEYLKSLVSQL